MSLGEHASDSAPFFSSDSEAEGPEDQGGPAAQRQQEEVSASGVTKVRAVLTVFILCYINLLNYMDRFTVAGTQQPISRLCLIHSMLTRLNETKLSVSELGFTLRR